MSRAEAKALPGAGEDMIDFRRRVPVQAQPFAGLKLGDATGHTLRRGRPVGKQGAKPNLTAHRIVPAVLGRVRLVERERLGSMPNFVHPPPPKFIKPTRQCGANPGKSF
jgi:hypothetical protein